MSDAERSIILRTSLYLMLLEGWVRVSVVRERFGRRTPDALGWLQGRGLVEVGDMAVVRWCSALAFEELWAELVPERSCPMHLRTIQLDMDMSQN